MKNGETKSVDLSGQNILTMRDAQSAVAAGATQVRVCEKCVITPSAHDFLRQNEIELVTGSAVAAAPAPAPKPAAAAAPAPAPVAASSSSGAKARIINVAGGSSSGAKSAPEVRRAPDARLFSTPRPRPSSWRFARSGRSCGTASMSTATAAIFRTASDPMRSYARRPW